MGSLDGPIAAPDTTTVGGAGGASGASGATPAPAEGIPGVAPAAPTVTAVSPSYTRTPTWMWKSGGGGGNGTFRVRVDSPDLSTGAVETRNAFFTPLMPLTDGLHRLFVAERNDAGKWSGPGNAEILITAGPISHYPFDNHAMDVGINQNHGTVKGPRATPDHLGNPNGALLFDGIDDGISTGLAKYGVETNATVSAWIKTNPAEDGLFFPFAGQMGFMTRNGKEAGFYVSTGLNSSSALAAVPAGVWTHVLGTFDGRVINTYVNGVLAATEPHPGKVEWIPNPSFGDYRGLGDEFWAGALDDVRIYNHVLSVTEIKELFESK